jgi:pimeloyl-ACP methyl ester carboxylesterase
MNRSYFTRLAAALALAAATVGAGLVGPQPASATTIAWHSTDLNLTVPVGVDGLSTATIHAIRYTPIGRVRGVQIMVPGVTYDHHYFDLQTDHGLISQARDAAKQGWVAIAVDRVGTGGSSKPTAGQVTTATNIAALGGFADRVDRLYHRLPLVLVGHSYGSVIAEGVAAESKRVDGLVITGFLYRQTSPSFDGFPTLVPANTDPVFTGRQLPADYLTTEPGSRSFFYATDNVDPATLRADERTKATTTATEVPGFGNELFSGALAAKVRLPVLIVVGDNDFLYRGDDPSVFQTDQENAFAQATNVSAAVIPDAGHDLALQRNAVAATTLIDTWATTHAG